MSDFDLLRLLQPHVRALEPYAPILPLEVLSRRLHLPVEQIVKLDANENPYGPLPEVLEALARYDRYHIYPDPQQTELREALAAFHSFPSDQILPTHGADELLDLLCRMTVGPDEAIINCPPTFGMYEFDAALTGARVLNVARRPDFTLDVETIEALAQRERPRVLFLTSPNNPSGDWLDDETLRRLLALPLLVLLDEAYVEFAGFPSRASWVLEYTNLVVARTFSKAAGIAGLRLGYGFCPPWLMPHLWTFKQPYNVNVAATVAGLASLAHADKMAAVVERIKAERTRLLGLLGSIGWLQPSPSEGNFILCRVVGRDAAALKRLLEVQGILVRHYSKPGLENSIRVSVGRPRESDALLAALRAVD